MRIIGIDPGLRKTGWGIISLEAGNRVRHIANGTIRPPADHSLGNRLLMLHTSLLEVLDTYQPETAALEEVFVNKNPKSSLLLSHARGVVLMSAASYGLSVTEYGANKVKKTVVGAGHADKQQMMAMINILLPATPIDSEDSADALAIAICHGQHRLLWDTMHNH